MATRCLILALVVALSGAWAHELRIHRAFTRSLPHLAQLPAAPAGWRSDDHPITENIAAILAADATLQRRYRNEQGAEVWLFVAYFASQAVNSQIHSPRHCLPGSGWTVQAFEPETVSLSRGRQPATRMLIELKGRRQEMVYWFRTRGGIVSGEYALKWDLLRNSLAGRPTDAAFVRYSAPTQDVPAMRELMLQLDAPMNAILDEVGLK